MFSERSQVTPNTNGIIRDGLRISLTLEAKFADDSFYDDLSKLFHDNINK